jgi:hypothetical protein
MANQIMVKMVLDAWYSKIKEANEIFDKLTDEQLQMEVAPNRNRGIYLLGHLAATHDGIFPLLGFGDRFYPQLDEIYIDNPDRSRTQTISASELRAAWEKVNSTLADHFSKLSSDAWFEKHNAVSNEDFIKQPHRNKLNVMITRTTHLSYHNGQLIFLTK